MKELVTLKSPVTLSLTRQYSTPETFQQQTKHIAAECEGLSDDKKTITYKVHGYIPLGSERHAIYELNGLSGPVMLEMRADNVLSTCEYKEAPLFTKTCPIANCTWTFTARDNSIQAKNEANHAYSVHSAEHAPNRR